jgi:DNA repair exonuclease SbcCD ATPase subunit
MQKIFDDLAEALVGSGAENERERLEKKRELAQSLVEEAKQDREHALDEVKDSKAALAEARVARAEEETLLRGSLDAIEELLSDADDEIKQELSAASERLGLPEIAKSYRSLRESTKTFRSLSGRLTATMRLAGSSKWTSTLLLLGLTVGLPLLVTVTNWGIEAFSTGSMNGVVEGIASAAAFVTGIAEWFRRQLKRADREVQTVEAAFREARQGRRDKLQSEDVQRQRATLEEAKDREAAAKQALQKAEERLQRIEQQLREFAPERRLEQLILERSRGDRYRQHLGIISLIREDFERMGSLLKEIAEKRPSEA